ncbi:MAG: DUF4838 domain-containing protein, partial [Armatimonadetes bacterium]|nr:DUF4838 domain-containing protein [Armatimonadota bacterium]
LVRRVRAWLRESPGASIVSVSQNDHAGACECRRCADIDAREGSHAGSVLDLANHVAREIEAEYPHVAVDTLAYQYTRKAPRRLRPRHNVIVRLCSIECNFARPLTDRTNASFARDLRDWSRLTRRLYVWDYTTDFSHYLLPFPNWHHLGANVRFYHRNGVRGLFEQGAYQSHSCEMSELRPWVLAQLLWNPYQDDRKLIREFLEAYYGAAAPHIERWFRLIERAAKPYYVGIGHPDASPFLRFATLAECERIWREAEAAVAADPDRLWRVRQARLIPRYLWLSQWVGLQRECRQEGAIWPVEQLRAGAAAAWLSVVTGQGPAGWAPMTTMRESGQAPAAFVASLGPDPDEAESRPAKRLASVPVGDLVAPASRWHREVYVQDDRAIVFREPVCARPMEDAGASDGVVIRMVAGAEGARGAIEIHGADLPKAVRPGRYELYYEVRADVAPGAPASAEAFQMRVHDPIAGLYTADRIVSVGELKPGYARYLAGIVGIHQYVRIWMGHARAPAVRSVLFDRLILVRER